MALHITYIVVDYKEPTKETFPGASQFTFESTIRINIMNAEDAKKWLDSMQHSKCTYRHTRGRNPGLKRVLFKVEMHCQHQKKALTPKQVIHNTEKSKQYYYIIYERKNKLSINIKINCFCSHKEGHSNV